MIKKLTDEECWGYALLECDFKDQIRAIYEAGAKSQFETMAYLLDEADDWHDQDTGGGKISNDERINEIREMLNGNK